MSAYRRILAAMDGAAPIDLVPALRASGKRVLARGSAC